ncbi:methyltransferase, partial [Candidatus Pelagibacter sp.]|nr:methyltransferase [Candidatus Pelagibacter sp.]
MEQVTRHSLLLNKDMKNKDNKTLGKSFFELSKLDHLEFLFHLPNKKNVVLDFGCGNGAFHKKFHSKKIKLIKMYDKNKMLKSQINKKYKKNSFIKWTSRLTVD